MRREKRVRSTNFSLSLSLSLSVYPSLPLLTLNPTEFTFFLFPSFFLSWSFHFCARICFSLSLFLSFFFSLSLSLSVSLYMSLCLFWCWNCVGLLSRWTCEKVAETGEDWFVCFSRNKTTTLHQNDVIGFC